MSLPPMGVTIYGRPPSNKPGYPSLLELVVHHPGGSRMVHRVNLWDHGDQLAHDTVHNRDQTARGMLADWADENQDQFQSIPPEYRPYMGQLIRRGHRWPPEPPDPVGHETPPARMSRGPEPVPPLTLALSDPGSAAEYGPRALSAVRGVVDRREKDRFQRRVVSRFGRAPTDEVLGIAAQQREHGGGYDPHNQSDMILADKLADHGDPLETVVRRDLSYRIPGHSGVSGFNSRVDRHATELGGAGSPLGQSIHVAEYELPVGTLNLGRYGDDGKGNALSYYVNWLPPYPGGSYAAAMSPEETIHLLNEHGVPHDLKPPFRSTGTGPEHLSRRPRRYSATEGDVQNLLSQIATNPEHQQPGSHLRLVAADALQERGRDREADVLRNHRHLVYVEGGRVLRDFHLPVTHQQTALDWHGGGGSELYGIGSTGNVTGESARRALEEIDDIRNDYGNSEELSNPDNRRGLDRLYDHLSRIERETADERGEEPEHLSRIKRTGIFSKRYAAYYKGPPPFHDVEFAPEWPDEEPPEPEFPQDHDPDEGDYFITTHGDEHRVHQHGHEVMRFPVDTGDAEIRTRLREHADQEQFWPDAWMIYSPNSHDHYPYSRRRYASRYRDLPPEPDPEIGPEGEEGDPPEPVLHDTYLMRCVGCGHLGDPDTFSIHDVDSGQSVCPHCGRIDWHEIVDEPEQMSRRRYTAYRAPAGGMISRGTHQPGGQFVPDLNGEFMRGARKVLGPVQKRESPDPTVSFGGIPKWAEWRRKLRNTLSSRKGS